MINLRFPAIVIHTYPARDSDLLVALLGEEAGRLSAFARHSRSSRKRFMGGLDLFDCGVFELTKTAPHQPFRVESFTQREYWPNIRTDLQKYSLASYCLELTSAFAKEDDPEACELFRPLHRTLRTLNKSVEKHTNLVLTVYYNLTLLRLTGYDIVHHQSEKQRDEFVHNWFASMLDAENPIQPFDESLAMKGFQTLGSFSQEIIGRKLRCLSAVGDSLRARCG